VPKPSQTDSLHILVGYIQVSTEGDRHVLNLQRDALLGTGVDERHLFEDRAGQPG
jgi:hypothetical protein